VFPVPTYRVAINVQVLHHVWLANLVTTSMDRLVRLVLMDALFVPIQLSVFRVLLLSSMEVLLDRMDNV
jgi:hypothetical protein